VYAIDLLGPLLRRIERQWNALPTLKPGLLVLDVTNRSIEEIAEKIAAG
jgi:regulator of PEP synthase PpsR (kinase-PPPase family)